LQLYDLKVHHLTPLGILHIETLVTLCKAYMGIESHFDLWNYFYHAKLRQGSDVEPAVLGSVDHFIQSGSEIDANFYLLMSDPLVGWWKVWSFLGNDVDAPLPLVTGRRCIPQPKWGYGVA
jgi:hypothetical protein